MGYANVNENKWKVLYTDPPKYVPTAQELEKEKRITDAFVEYREKRGVIETANLLDDDRNEQLFRLVHDYNQEVYEILEYYHTLTTNKHNTTLK